MKKVILLLLLLLMASCGNENYAGFSIDIPKNKTTSNSTDVSVEIDSLHQLAQAEAIRSLRDKAEFREGEVLVKFRPDAGQAAVLRTHQAVGGRVLRKFSAAPGIELVRLPRGVPVKEALLHYTTAPGVEYAEPNYIRRRLSTIPNDPRFSEQWALRNTGQFGGTSGADIKATEAWNISQGNGSGTAVVIAVLDTGIDLNHPDLIGNLWINRGETSCTDGIDNDSSGKIDDCNGWNFVNETNKPLDDDGHGTHVSGIIGARGNNSTGIAGVMWNAELMVLKFIGLHGSDPIDDYYGTIADEIAAIDYAILMKTQKNVNVKAINASFGGYDISSAERDAIIAARDAGIIVVAAAGNDGGDSDKFPVFPASYSDPKHGCVANKGCCDNVISVAATDQRDQLAWFSDFGLTTVQVAAPGSTILSTVPGGYDTFSGTSMAAPHVSGLVGLLSAYYTHFTYSQIRSTILASVDQLQALSGLIQTGGRINAYKALSSLRSPTSVAVTDRTSGTVSLAWNDNATAESGYRIERKAGSGSFALLEPLLPINASAFNDSNLTDGTLYTYRVTAFNAIGNSPSSDEVTAVTILNAPTGLNASANSTSQITLSWADNSRAEEGYRIERKDPAGTFVQIATVGPNTTAFSDSGLTPNTTYLYRVRAFNTAAGFSQYSNEASVTTSTVSQPPAPSGGGGGGCSIGAQQNTPTAVADLLILLLPLAVVIAFRSRR